MTEEEKQVLSDFETKLRHLLFLYQEMKQECEDLRKSLEYEKLKNENLQTQYDQLKISYSNLKTGTTISLNGSDVNETKLRLSELVREVDKCIALLE